MFSNIKNRLKKATDEARKEKKLSGKEVRPNVSKGTLRIIKEQEKENERVQKFKENGGYIFYGTQKTKNRKLKKEIQRRGYIGIRFENGYPVEATKDNNVYSEKDMFKITEKIRDEYKSPRKIKKSQP